jgi:hypothetical protein
MSMTSGDQAILHIDLDALVETSAWMADVLGRPPASRVAEALLAPGTRGDRSSVEGRA